MKNLVHRNSTNKPTRQYLNHPKPIKNLKNQAKNNKKSTLTTLNKR